MFAALNGVANPLDLIGKHVGRSHLYRGRQVNNDRLTLVRAPHFSHCIDDFSGKIQLGTGKALRRILKGPFGVRVTGGQLLHQTRTLYCNITDAITV